MSEIDNLRIWPGRHVELEVHYTDGEIEYLSLDIVTDDSSDFVKGFIGESTPLARAIIGKVAGTTVAYQAGIVRILSVSLSTRTSPNDTNKRREEVIQKAVNDSNKTSIILFASSFNGKWGDYDPGSIQDKDEDEMSLNQKNDPTE